MLPVLARADALLDQGHAAVEQGSQQSVQDHRVTDVRDHELVETQHATARGDARGYLRQGITHLAKLAQVCVHVEHEAMEMHAQRDAGRQ